MKHNFTQLNLLRNKDFYLVNKDGAKVYFKIPLLEDFIADEDLITFLGLLNMDWKSLDLSSQIENIYDLIIFMAFNDFHTEEIARTLDKFLIDASLRSNGVYIQEKRLTKEEFEFITNAWLIAVGSKNLDSLTDPTLSVIIDPLEQKMKDSEDKIKRIKQQKTEKVEAAALQLDKIIVAVITEFNKSMEDVMNLSIYTLLWYYNYALRLNAYRVETIAYGNGLIKKHRYFAE